MQGGLRHDFGGVCASITQKLQGFLGHETEALGTLGCYLEAPRSSGVCYGYCSCYS